MDLFRVGWFFTVDTLMIMHSLVLTEIQSICPLTHYITPLQPQPQGLRVTVKANLFCVIMFWKFLLEHIFIYYSGIYHSVGAVVITHLKGLHSNGHFKKRWFNLRLSVNEQ